jgi:hypothetical protein
MRFLRTYSYYYYYPFSRAAVKRVNGSQAGMQRIAVQIHVAFARFFEHTSTETMEKYVILKMKCLIIFENKFLDIFHRTREGHSAEDRKAP